ncbi:hypothetical protein N9O57_00745 [bacterium]|nr:hypothetical protein [bacterium]
MKNKKPLIALAYLGEARAFINHFNYTKHQFGSDLYYACDDHYLLITGEGKYECLTRLSALCAKLENNLSCLINLGIAASLDLKIELRSSHFIRTIYHENYDHFEFKSFTSDYTGKGPLDGISVDKRVLSKKDISHLNIIAPIVDREAWALGFVANKFKIPFYIRKTISDHPQNESNCQLIRDNAKEWSQLILKDYLSLNLEFESSTSKSLELDPQLFYFTKSMQDKFDHLKRKITPSQKIIQNLSTHKVSAKQRAALLIDSLEKKMSPVKSQIKKDLDSMTEQKNFKIYYDPTFEESELEIRAQFCSEEKKNKIIKELEAFKFSELKNYIEGDNDLL